MTDIENKVTDTIIKAVKAAYPKAVVEDRFNPTPSGFPYVAIYEMDNSEAVQYIDNLPRELYSNVAYEAQVFTNDKYRKSTAKAIAQIIDTAMRGMGFVRTFKQPIPNIDRTIYRIALRYSAIVQEGIVNGDTTTYLLYH